MLELSFDGFDAAISSGPVVVDFYLPDCGPCRLLYPILATIAKNEEGVSFYKIDASAAPELATKYNIRQAPTVVFFRDGEEKTRLVGMQPAMKIRETILAL